MLRIVAMLNFLMGAYVSFRGEYQAATFHVLVAMYLNQMEKQNGDSK